MNNFLKFPRMTNRGKVCFLTTKNNNDDDDNACEGENHKPTKFEIRLVLYKRRVFDVIV